MNCIWKFIEVRTVVIKGVKGRLGMKVFIFFGNRVEEGSASSVFLEMLMEQLKWF